MFARRLVRTSLAWAVLAGWALASLPAAAAEFKSVGADPAILYDAPTARGGKLAIAPRGMPLEVVLVQGDWVRVRDSSGGLSWVDKRALVDRRMLVTLAPVSTHAAPDEGAPVTMRLDGGVLVELTEAPGSGWVNVKHRDGASGWLKVSEVWGL